MSIMHRRFSIRKSAKSSNNVWFPHSRIVQINNTLTVKLKYGSDEEEDNSETDSEEDESEDEDGEELTPAVDAAILRTLARIKRKDPEIYNNKTGIFKGAHTYTSLTDITEKFLKRSRKS